MAITRRWQAGFELVSVIELSGVSAFPPSASTVQKKTGSYAMSVISNGDGVFGWIDILATRQIRVGWYLYFDAPLSSTDENRRLFQVRDASGNNLISIKGKSLAAGSPLILEVAGSNQDTEAGAFTTGAFYHLAIDMKINSVAGWVKIYKDGVEILTFSGNTGNADIVRVCLGAITSRFDATPHYDDIYIDDTTGEGAPAAPPILRFYYTTLNADGNYSQWDGSDGNQVNNYLLVDELPPNSDTDYVETNVVDEFDSYSMTTITLEAGQQVEAVIPIAFVKRTGSTEQIALGTRLSGTDVVGSDQAPGTSYDTLWERQTTKPGGGTWGQSDIDGFEAVIKSRGSY